MIKLELTLDEVNKIMACLGNAPYAQVADLVEKIKQQVVPQVQQQAESAPAEPVEQPKE
jgi:hypothetical protein